MARLASTSALRLGVFYSLIHFIRERAIRFLTALFPMGHSSHLGFVSRETLNQALRSSRKMQEDFGDVFAPEEFLSLLKQDIARKVLNFRDGACMRCRIGVLTLKKVRHPILYDPIIANPAHITVERHIPHCTVCDNRMKIPEEMPSISVEGEPDPANIILELREAMLQTTLRLLDLPTE